jgi:hypothetical protein
MRLRKSNLTASAWLAVGIGVIGAPIASAAAAGRDAGARPTSSAGPKSELPPGHPPTGSAGSVDQGDEMPPGHPRTSARAAPTKETVPEDESDVDDTLPAGTIVVELRDASDRAVPRADVTLGILQQSVAKGESRRHVSRAADEAGTARFDGLEFGGGVAYRVTVPWGNTGGDNATYAAMPFQLDLHHGQRVRIHLYPVTNRVSETMLGMDGIVYMELRDDAIQFDELFRVYNVGGVTWVPSDVVVTLPPGFKAFLAQKEMSDAGWEEVPGRGAKLRGTFGPGSHETHFRYQVPYSGDESVDFTTSLPPHVARMRVMAEASKGMTLHVADFPTSVSDRNPAGQRILLTERQLRAGEAPPSELRMTLDNIPTEGSAKWIATAIAAATVLLGIFIAFEQEKNRSKRNLPDHEAERARTRLVAEIAELDKARATGDVGPKAYERIHAALIDALAHLMGSAEPNA